MEISRANQEHHVHFVAERIQTHDMLQADPKPALELNTFCLLSRLLIIHVHVPTWISVLLWQQKFSGSRYRCGHPVRD